MAKAGKRYEKAAEAVDSNKSYSLDEAIALVKDNAKAKFDETIDVAMNLGVDPKHSDQMVRGAVSMPNGLGKSVRVAVFAKGPKADEAKDRCDRGWPVPIPCCCSNPTKRSPSGW